MSLIAKKVDREADSATDEIVREVQYAAKLHGVPTRDVVDVVLDHDEGEEEHVGKERRGKTGMWVTLVIVGVIFGLAIVGLMKLSNMADQSGPTAVSGIQQINASIAPKVTNPLLSGIHIIFNYPGVFDEVTHPGSESNTGERYELASSSDYRETIQVYVLSTPLDYDSGYLWRSQNPQIYTPTPVKVMGEPAVMMVKSDNSERTLYWVHTGHLVIMSATGDGNLLQGYMDVITQSLRWQP